MKKGNIIDFLCYRDQNADKTSKENPPMSQELQEAIQNLIHQLRETDPVKH